MKSNKIVNSKLNSLALIATQKVIDAGGKISFDDYDEAMKSEVYIPPLNWINGWGLPHMDKKANDDKMCAFEACRRGYINQTEGSYVVTSE